jgi:excinuclease ABC subunit B
VLRHLVDLQYQRNDADLARARFRVRGDTLEFKPASEERIVRVEFFGDEVERITELDSLTGELLADRREVNVYPATHYVTPADKLKAAIVDIEAEMEERVGQLEAEGRELEGARLRQRTTFDLEMLRELGYCSGVENYSRHLSRRDAGSRPWTLLDYFPPDWLLVVDESHMTVPQVVGMYKNDRTRKEILVDFGFRLPSALDNRPLTFEEFEGSVHQAVYMSATPGPYELEKSERIVQQLIRPTGVVDPFIRVRPTEGQIDDLLDEIRSRTERGERAIVTTLTKRMAEDLTDYLREIGIKVQYLHSEVDTLERVAILRDLRLGVFDVVVGINLLREGIDLPEVTLVAILDADKEGFLRSAWSLIQMIGRAARNIGGEVVMYADRMTDSMKAAIEETDRRRAVQERYNTEHGIVPATIVKGIRDINDQLRSVAEATTMYTSERDSRLAELDRGKVEQLVTRMEAEMRAAAKELEFERAAALRDEIQQIRLRILDEDQSTIVARAAEAAGARGGAASASRAAGPASAGAAGARSGAVSTSRGTGAASAGAAPADAAAATAATGSAARDGAASTGSAARGSRATASEAAAARVGRAATAGRSAKAGTRVPARAAANAEAAVQSGHSRNSSRDALVAARVAVGLPAEAAPRRDGPDRDPDAPGSVLEVSEVVVLPAGEEPSEAAQGDGTVAEGNGAEGSGAEGTAADWLPGIRDEHDDEGGWQARWLDRPTWDRSVTPNIRRRTGTRPPRRRRS